MTRAVRDRILKDANGDIGDHLRNHIHLTNCIHLKNHMHKHSPMLNDRSLMRDLMVLQRSRSLRDPSASPPMWHSPLTANMVAMSGDMASLVGRRMSTGVDRHRVGRRIYRTSPQHQSVAAEDVKISEAEKATRGVVATSEHSSMSGSRDGRKGKKKESVGINDPSHNNERPRNDGSGSELSRETASENSEQNGRESHVKGTHSQERIPVTLSEKLSEVPGGLHKKHSQHEGTCEQLKPSGRASCSGLIRVRRNKLRRMKKPQASASKKDTRAHEEPSVASNSSVRALGQQAHRIEEEQEDDCGANNVTRAPRNGCGILWNWSRIHHSGKSLIDMAGRSFSCGLSDSRLKRGGSMSQSRDIMALPRASDESSSSSKYNEVLPLLVDGYGSQETSENAAAWEHDYSGELGIFANSLLKHETESDTTSKSRSGAQQKSRGNRRGMHQSLTQKYMPRSFRDLVGQNLVVQALSNAVVRRKMGLLYVFYGPHGTGKTSCARILARALSCQSMEHPKPCGSCSSCITHDLGKSTSIKEVGPVSNLDFESIMDLLESMMISQQGSQYRVFIFDDCDTLSADCWSAISKVIDRAPRRVVFMLICSSLDILPHVIITRCQKFFFPKLKDADIIYTLQWIATKEGLEIDKHALKLIASRSDGSLRDAEMTLEQLSLLGQRISVTLVQELVGLISDEKLVDLLDLALSADTVNTVKSLRELMESGAEPLALMSQLATVITDILAGSYDFIKGRRRRRFFKQPALAKEDMEKLRQALKTLSEAEKQLRVSNDKVTWLTAALLQLAPDRQYILPNSSVDTTSFNHSPLVLNDKAGREVARKSNAGHTGMSYGRSLDSKNERFHTGTSADVYGSTKIGARITDKRRHVGGRVTSQQILGTNTDADRSHRRSSFGIGRAEIDEIWLDVLDKIQISSIKEFLYQEAKLVSVSYSAAPSVQLGFSSSQTKSKAEKLRTYILQAFESTFGCAVLVDMRAEPRKDVAAVVLPPFEGGSSELMMNSQFLSSENCVPLHNGLKHGTSEIVEVATTPRKVDRRTPEASQLVLEGASQKLSNMASQSQQSRLQEQNQCRSLVKSKVSLAHVIQQTEGCVNHNSWTKRKAVSIAEKLEEENLRLEPRTRNLLCWKVSRATQQKFSRLKIRTRRSRSFLKLVSCGKCLSSKSPR